MVASSGDDSSCRLSYSHPPPNTKHPGHSQGPQLRLY